ncbi:MAG: phosphoribosylglycinamide formyltransferase [Planctomycetota bacterium]|jgi:formyltetrahydrofolate-dependent phosphoribosylglycinamide formyltransferase
MSKPLRLAVVLSGSGTTLQNFLDRIEDGSLPATVVGVISSIEGAYGLERARAAGLPARTVARGDFSTRAEFSAAMAAELDGFNPGLTAFAGFIHRLELPERYDGKVMNVHPALIPAFCGKGFYYDRVHREALQRGVKVSGCTVHFVDSHYDEGPIILQKVVEVHDDDTVASLRDRVQAAERAAYPEAIRLFARGRLRVEGRRVLVEHPPGE